MFTHHHSQTFGTALVQSSRPTLKEMRDEGYAQAKLDVLAVLMKHDPDAYLRNATRIRELKP